MRPENQEVISLIIEMKMVASPAPTSIRPTTAMVMDGAKASIS